MYHKTTASQTHVPANGENGGTKNPTPYTKAFATISLTGKVKVFMVAYFDSSLTTIQMATKVPMTPPASVPSGTSRPVASSQRRPNQTDKPMDPAMVKAMPENRKKEPCFGLRLGAEGVNKSGIKPRQFAASSQRQKPYRDRRP